MKIPTVVGTIDRRILINYQVDQDVLAQYLPAPFQPKTVKGKGIVGICLIRLKGIRPKGLPEAIGISSENGAHRVAVEWEANGRTEQGVYIPRRDTSSRINSWAGGRIFPGTHHLANFQVDEHEDSYKVGFTSNDNTSLSIEAQETTLWSTESVFNDLQSASDFFENGTVGYSPASNKGHYDGLELTTYQWEVKPLKVSSVQSSFFEDASIFPKGSVKFDNALLMKNIGHEWKGLKKITEVT